MNANSKLERLNVALETLRNVSEEIMSLHNGGLTYREVDEALFNTEPGRNEDVSGKLVNAIGPYSWLNRFSRSN